MKIKENQGDGQYLYDHTNQLNKPAEPLVKNISNMQTPLFVDSGIHNSENLQNTEKLESANANNAIVTVDTNFAKHAESITLHKIIQQSNLIRAIMTTPLD